jgi:hypothetical protein
MNKNGNHRFVSMQLGCVAAVLLLGGAGCGLSDRSDESAVGSQGVFVLETAEQGKAREQAASSEAKADDPGVPGEGPQAENPFQAAQNCVYIDWCNEPGSWGTVCRVYASCLSQCSTNLGALLSECTADANYVCGGITQPAVVRCY